MSKLTHRRILMGLFVGLPVLVVILGLWTWQRVLLGRGYAYANSSLRFSDDGEYVLANLQGSLRGDLRATIWNAETGRLRAFSLSGMVATSPNGEYLAELVPNQPLKLWRVADQKKILEIPMQKGVGGFDFTADNRSFVVFMVQASLDVYDLKTASRRASLPMKEDGADPQFSPDGRTLAVTSLTDGWLLRLIDLADARVLFTIRQPAETQASRPKLFFSPDGRQAVTRALEGDTELLQIRALPAGQPRTLYRGPTRSRHAADVVFSPDSRLAAVEFGPEPHVQIFNASTDRAVASIPLRRRAKSVSFSKNGERIAITNTRAIVAAAAPGWEPAALEDPGYEFVRSWTAPDGGTIAGLRDDGAVRVWNAAGAPVGLVKSDRERPREVLYSPDGKILAVLARRYIRIWDADAAAEKIRLTLPYRGYGIAFSPDGGTLAAGAWRAVHLWSADGSSFLRSMSVPPNPAGDLFFGLIDDFRNAGLGDMTPPDIDVTDPLLPETR